jgi:hypothetical protein
VLSLSVLANDGLERASGLSRSWPKPKPVVDMHIWTVALLIRSNASRQASAGGHFCIRSPRTDVAAKTVKSTSSRVWGVVLVKSFKDGGDSLPGGSEPLQNARQRIRKICQP